MKKTPFALALMAILGVQTSLAQTFQSEEVVISASRIEEDLFQVTKSVSVATQESLRESGQDTLPSMLEDETSVGLVSDGTPGVKRVSLRSESSSRTLLLVDGQRIDDAKTKSGAPFLVNPFFIDRVEILRGSSSVLYGSDALGGIVQVFTKDYSEKPFSFEVGGNFNSSGNGFAEYLNASGSLDKFHYKASVFGTEMGDVYLSDRERLDNTSYRQKGGNVGLAYDINSKFTLELIHEYFDLDANTASDSTDQDYANFKAHIPQWKREKTSLNFAFKDLNELVEKLNFSFYLQENDKDFNSQVSARGPYVYALNEQDTKGATGQIDLALSPMFYLISGFEVRRDELKSDSGAQFGENMGPVVSSMRLNIEDRDLKQDTYALYSLLETYLTDSLTLETGLRYTYVKTDSGNSALDVGPMKMPLSQNQDSSDNFLVGSVGLNWALNEENALRASFSQGYRSPNLQEMYLTTFTGEVQLGNPDLKEERSNSFELGFNHQGEQLDLDVNLFYTKAKDYIDTYQVFEGAMDIYSYRNISKAISYGVELDTKLYLDPFTAYSNLTVMRRKYETATEESYDTLTPLLKGRLGLRYDDVMFNQNYHVDLFSRFATKADNDNLDGASYFDDSHLAGYMTLNLGFGMDFFNESLKVYGSFENILDKDYRTSELISEPGRFFTLGFSYTY